MINQRIGIVLPGLYAGGVETLFMGIANCLLARGYEVDLVLLSLSGNYRHSIPRNMTIFGATVDSVDPDFCNFLYQQRSLNYLHLSQFNLLTNRIAHRWELRHAGKSPRKSHLARDAEIVYQYLQWRNPRALLSGPAKANYAALLGNQSLFRRARTVVTIHSNYAVGRNFKTKEWSRLLYPKADWIVGVSRGAAECARATLQLPADNVTYIYNGFDIGEIQRKANAKNQPGCKIQQFGMPVILSVGRLATDGQKDFETVIKAFAMVRRNQAVKLVLLCPGNHNGTQMERLRSLCAQFSVQDDVVFLEFDENPFSYMRHASMLVLSSQWEGFANVLVEAMACGTPVVSTDSPFGPAEVLDYGRYGPLVPVGDVNLMACAMTDVLRGIRKDGSLLRSRAMEFSIERTTDGYERLLIGAQ